MKTKLYIYIILSLMNHSCNHKTITSLCKEPLTVIAEKNGYIINLDSSNLVHLVNDTSNKTCLVFWDNKKEYLDFYITPPYLTRAYLSEIKEVGRLLILESSPVGCSGLIASITNVSIIFLDDSATNRVFSYNSFNGGVCLLKHEENITYLDIYDYHDVDKHSNPIYCLTVFEFTIDGFTKKEMPQKCFILQDNELIDYNDCDNCKIIKEPYVYKGD